MNVPIIHAGGVQAYADSFLRQTDNYNEATWMVSMFGSGVALQSIYASLLTGRAVDCFMPSGKTVTFALPTWRSKFHSIVKRIPGQVFRHMVVYPEIAMQRSGESHFVLVGMEGTDFPHMLYRYLVKRVEVPIHKSWKQWMWSLFRSEEWLHKLSGYGRLRGYVVDGYWSLDTSITEAVRTHQLGVSNDGEA